jgi:hypothetical protein
MVFLLHLPSGTTYSDLEKLANQITNSKKTHGYIPRYAVALQETRYYIHDGISQWDRIKHDNPNNGRGKCTVYIQLYDQCSDSTRCRIFACNSNEKNKKLSIYGDAQTSFSSVINSKHITVNNVVDLLSRLDRINPGSTKLQSGDFTFTLNQLFDKN